MNDSDRQAHFVAALEGPQVGDILLMILIVFFWAYLLDKVEYHFPAAGKILREKQTVLIDEGRLIRRNMRREMVTEEELMAVLRKEGIDDPAKALAPFVVGYVAEAKQHPNAYRLRVCRVDTGKGNVQVVCGAPNARTGMKGVFAPPGTHIPGTGLDLKAGNIRGEASNGMLCSARELGLGQDHDGIIELPDDAPIGMSFVKYRNLDDPVIEIKVTPK